MPEFTWSPIPGRHRSAVEHRLAVLLVSIAMLAGPLIFATGAAASWTHNGSGGGTATVGSLAPPTDVNVPKTSKDSVKVRWTKSSGSPTPTGYLVIRNDGNKDTPACGSTPDKPVTSKTGCTDKKVPAGDYVYTVTAIYRSWTAPGVPSGTVRVT